jgi:hypothetical protein
MQRTRTSGYIGGALATILAIIPGCSSNKPTVPPEPDNKPTVESLQAENQELKERVDYLEDTDYWETYADVLEKENDRQIKTILGLEGQVNRLSTKLAVSDRDNSKLERELDKALNPDDVEAWKAEKAKLEKELDRLYANSVVNKNYPVDGILRLFKETKTPYQEIKATETLQGMCKEEREAFYLAFLNPHRLLKSYSPEKRERYEEFFRNRASTQEKRDIPKNTGIYGNMNDKYSAFSLAVFEVFEIALNVQNEVIRLPAVR